MAFFNMQGFKQGGKEDIIDHTPYWSPYACWAPMGDILRKYKTDLVIIRNIFKSGIPEQFTKQEIAEYLKLLNVFFPGYRFNRIKMVDDLLKENTFNLDMRMPGVVAFGAGTIIRYLFEYPHVATTYLKLKKYFKEVEHWKLFMLSHTATLSGCNGHSGHSIIHSYGDDFKINPEFNPHTALENFLKRDPNNRLPANQSYKFTGMLNEVYDPVMTSTFGAYGIRGPKNDEDLIAKAKGLLA